MDIYSSKIYFWILFLSLFIPKLVRTNTNHHLLQFLLDYSYILYATKAQAHFCRSMYLLKIHHSLNLLFSAFYFSLYFEFISNHSFNLFSSFNLHYFLIHQILHHPSMLLHHSIHFHESLHCCRYQINYFSFILPLTIFLYSSQS